jgi:hypothetical protein
MADREAYLPYVERPDERGNEETWARTAHPRRMNVSYPAWDARISETF